MNNEVRLYRSGLSSEITWIFERIGEEVCLLEDLRQFIIKSTGAETKKPWRINRIDALCKHIDYSSMQIIFSDWASVR